MPGELVEDDTTIRRRRRWSLPEKKAIVEETEQPGKSVSEVARKHGVHPNQIFSWRQLKNGKKEDSANRFHVLSDILKRLVYSNASLGVSELSRELAKNKVYIHRVLSSLESMGWVSRDGASQKYKLGNELVTFGLLLTSRFYLTKITLPYLYELSDISNETTAVCIRIGYERMWVQEIPAKHENRQTVILGQRYPLWMGASGQSMAAYLNDAEIDELFGIMRKELPTFQAGQPKDIKRYRNDLKEIKKQGYAISAGDYRPDICVLAAPIFDQSQVVTATIVIRGRLPEFNPNRAKKYIPVILEMANKINLEIKDLA